MDDIMEKNLRTFANGFMQQQSDYAKLLEENSTLKKQIYDMDALIDYAFKIIFDTTEQVTDKQKVGLIGRAINELYDKWNVWDITDLDYNEQ